MTGIVRRLLLGGAGLSAAIAAVGLVLLLHGGGAGLVTGPVRLPYGSLGGDLARGDAYAVLWLGLLVLVLTPLLRVVVSVLLFARQGDGRFLAMTLFVLAVLIGSVVAGVTL
jgi:uncharacterized membrane protein